METFTATTFTLGTSTVVTLPKKLGIKSGTRVELIKKGNRVEIKSGSGAKSGRSRDIELIKSLAGGISLPFSLTPDEVNKQYDKDVYGG